VADYVAANAQRVVDDIIAGGGQAEVLQMDVSNADSVNAGFKQLLDKHERLDVLVNAAGITKDGLIMRMSEADWDAVMNVNLKGAFLTTKAATRPMMKQRSGAIVNIASIMGQIGNAGQANYASSKGGLIALTKSTAKELGSRGIRANAVAPGWIETAMTDKLPDSVRDGMMTNIPLARLGSGADVAKVVLFLASDDAGYVTGQTLTVDGGLVMI
jgi:3-oxoacyl-[acyl-carrier protein] reductase